MARGLDGHAEPVPERCDAAARAQHDCSPTANATVPAAAPPPVSSAAGAHPPLPFPTPAQQTLLLPPRAAEGAVPGASGAARDDAFRADLPVLRIVRSRADELAGDGEEAGRRSHHRRRPARPRRLSRRLREAVPPRPSYRAQGDHEAALDVRALRDLREQGDQAGERYDPGGDCAEEEGQEGEAQQHREEHLLGLGRRCLHG
mmetsp:Transcript_15506/g.60646  ORF Transcript_15506/g.60646 Transcript_15506/m.60646 type:complete len:203 (+) Transcript_15506:1723-2331(+)